MDDRAPAVAPPLEEPPAAEQAAATIATDEVEVLAANEDDYILAVDVRHTRSRSSQPPCVTGRDDPS